MSHITVDVYGEVEINDFVTKAIVEGRSDELIEEVVKQAGVADVMKSIATFRPTDELANLVEKHFGIAIPDNVFGHNIELQREFATIKGSINAIMMIIDSTEAALG